MLKRFPSDKISITKNVLCFLSQAPTHHSFTFNLQFLYKLKQKVCSYKSVSGIFHFQFRFVLIRVYIFVQQKVWTLWLSNVKKFKILKFNFKIKKIEKPHTFLLSGLWLLSCNKKFENSVISAWVGAPEKLNWRRIEVLRTLVFVNGNF